MFDLLLQVALPGTSEMVILLFVWAIALVPAAAIYWDASRRGASYPPVWAVAMFFAAWTLVGIAVVVLLYYFLVIRDDSAGGQ